MKTRNLEPVNDEVNPTARFPVTAVLEDKEGKALEMTITQAMIQRAALREYHESAAKKVVPTAVH